MSAKKLVAMDIQKFLSDNETIINNMNINGHYRNAISNIANVLAVHDNVAVSDFDKVKQNFQDLTMEFYKCIK
jgi:hypothetical protein